jgi:hypothetical protein
MPGLPLPDGSRPPEPPAAPPPVPPEAATPAAATPPPPPSPRPEAPPAAAAAAAPTAGAPDERGVADLLREAYELYRRHARTLLITCAVVFVPATLVKSCALSVITGPTVVAGDSAPGAVTLFMLRVLAMLVTGFLLYGAVLLANGALTVAAADKILGGSAGWREAWRLVLRRLGPLVSAVALASALIGVGLALTVVPVLGIVFMVAALAMVFMFAFVAPVVLVEGLGGRAALWRSVELAWSDWLRVAITIIALAVACWLAQALAFLLLPRSAPFFGSLFGDLFTMVVLPVPVLGLVLLYFDIRRKREAFTQDGLRAGLETLRGG